MVADLTGFKTKYLPLTSSSENLSGLAAPELNSPDGTSKQAVKRISSGTTPGVGKQISIHPSSALPTPGVVSAPVLYMLSAFLAFNLSV